MDELAIIQPNENALMVNEVNATNNLVIYDRFIDNVLLKMKESKAFPAGIANETQAKMIITIGKSLGLDWAQSLNQIFLVNGKAALSANIMKSLLKTNNYKVMTVEDFTPFDIEKEVLNPETKVKEIKKVKSYRTTLRFLKINKFVIEGKLIKDEEELGEVSYTWEDIIKSELNQKDTYKKYPKEMLYNFCFRFGARRHCSDCLLGMYEVSELIDTVPNEMSYDLDPETGNMIVKPAKKK